MEKATMDRSNELREQAKKQIAHKEKVQREASIKEKKVEGIKQ